MLKRTQFLLVTFLALFSVTGFALTSAELLDQRLRQIMREIQSVSRAEVRLVIQPDSNLANAIELINPMGCIEASYVAILEPLSPCLRDQGSAGNTACVREGDQRWEALAREQGHLRFTGAWLIRLPNISVDESIALTAQLVRTGDRNAMAALIGLDALNQLIPQMGSWNPADVELARRGFRRVMGVCESEHRRDVFIEDSHKELSEPGQQRRSDRQAPERLRSAG